MWVTTKRIFRSGLQNFFRNGFVSFASVVIMMITLFIILATILLAGFFQFSLDTLKDKVDINVYFVTTAVESDILNIQKALEALPEVESVTYTSQAQALTNFEQKHQGDQLTIQALNELGTNPLEASLNIKAKDPSQYAGIASFLNSDNSELLSSASGTKIIDTIDYAQNQIVIDRLDSIIHSADMIGLVVAIIFMIISIVISFNTIRLTIYMSRDEISVMRLVGASSKYVKGPFVVNGIVCGFISALLVIVFFMGATYWVNAYHSAYFAGFNIFSYYTAHFYKILLIICGSGMLLGAVSSYLAVRKYLRS